MKTAAWLMAVIGLCFAFPLHAADNQHVVLCAALLPCNGDGSVQKPFDEGPCALLYAKQCQFQFANQSSVDLLACQREVEAQTEQVDNLREKYRSLNRRYRVLKHSRR